MDYGRKDFFIAADTGFRDAVDQTWFEGWKANVAYNHKPLITSVEESMLFNDVELDPLFTRDRFIERMKSLPPEHRDHANTYARAKNDAHFDFIFNAVTEELDYKYKAGEAPISAQLVGGLTDVLNLAFFIPAVGQVRAAKGVFDATKIGAGFGLAAGVASEARRAPFAYADRDWESASNIAMSTMFSGAFAGSAHFLAPMIKSSAKKVVDFASGRQVKHVFDDDGSVNIRSEDEGYVPQQGGDYEPVVGNWIGSPSQRRLSDPTLPDEIKKMFHGLTSNASVSVHGNRSQNVTQQSVAMKIAPFLGRYTALERQLRNAHHRDVMGMDDVEAPSMLGAYSPFTKDYDNWFEDTARRMVLASSEYPELRYKAQEGMTRNQADAIVKMQEVITEMHDDALAAKVFRRDVEIDEKIAKLNDLIKRSEEKANSIKAASSQGSKQGISKAQFKALDSYTKRINNWRSQIASFEAIKKQPIRPDYVFPIHYNKQLLMADEQAREGLTQVFTNHYRKERIDSNKTFKTSPREDAERTVSRILQEDADDFENLTADFAGGSKHLKQRKTNIPVSQVLDYMILDTDVMYSYIERMGKKIAFAESFGGRNIDEVLTDIKDILVAGGKHSETKIAEIRADFYGDYERVMGSANRRPDAFDSQAVKAAKSWSGMTYLPYAGYSAITDAGSMAMAHGAQNVLRAAVDGVRDMGYSKTVFRNLNFAGEALDVTRNFAAREILSDNIKRIQPNKLEKTVSVGNKVFYTANFLGPITTYGKFLDSYIVQDKFIRIAQKMAKGTVNKYDAEYAARFGITQELAEYAVKMPIDRSSSGRYFLSNTNEWPTDNVQARRAVRQWQAALSAHSETTVIMASTFDKPQIADGLLYMKDNAFFQQARKVFPNSFQIEDRVSTAGQKMVRMDSQALTLPFTFMNFAFGANNKIINAVRDPNRQHRLQGVAALLALSYLSLELKDKSWWRGAESVETVARVIDHSGLLGVYGDIGYMGLSMAVNSGLVDQDQMLIPPKYIDPDVTNRPLDALLEPFGAPVGLVKDTVRVFGNLNEGNYSQAHKDAFYVLPFVGLPYLRDDARDLWNAGR